MSSFDGKRPPHVNISVHFVVITRKKLIRYWYELQNRCFLNFTLVSFDLITRLNRRVTFTMYVLDMRYLVAELGITSKWPSRVFPIVRLIWVTLILICGIMNQYRTIKRIFPTIKKKKNKPVNHQRNNLPLYKLHKLFAYHFVIVFNSACIQVCVPTFITSSLLL